MPTDEPFAGPPPATWRARLDAPIDAARARVAARVQEWPRRTRIAGAALVLVAVAATWWFLRPPAHARIEDLLPRAVASGTPGTSSGAAAPSSSAAPGSSGAAAGGTGAAAPQLVVHVVGAVHAPGVVRVPAGSRVLDAVAAAGGPRDDADLARMNLAAKLVDGARVAVPALGQVVPEVVGDPGGAAASGDPGPTPATPVNLNDATAAQLDALPGVGPATAAAIIAFRTQNGPFRSVDALGDVRGIGPAKLEQLRPLVTV